MGDSLLGTVNVTVAAAEVFPSTMTTDWVFVRTVAIVIQPSTTWKNTSCFAQRREKSLTNCTIFPSTIEAVLVVWNVTDFVESFAHRIVIVAPKVFNASIFPIADVARWTVFVLLTTTEMLVPIVAANREHVRAVVVVDATLESESGAE